MTTRVQALRSSTSGAMPATNSRLPGELWSNFPDLQLGVIDASKVAQKLIAVRYFSTLANYAIGDFVVQAGALYVARVVITPGAFNAANWNKMINAADGAALPYLPLNGGILTGPLALSGANMLALIGAAATQRAILGGTGPAGSPSYRWQLILGDQTAESGANSGSNFVLNALNDSGGALSTPLTINRATGALTFGGAVNLAGPPTTPLQAATKAYVDSGVFVPLAGGTMTGPLVLAANPAAPLQSATKQYVDALPVAMNDNRLVNGDMRIDQRNAGAAFTLGGYTVDRWANGVSVAGMLRFQQQVGGAAPGFGYCLGVTSLSTYTIVAADIYALLQYIEADTVSDFQWGTANAQPVTLSFWASSSKTGAFSGSIRNYAGTRTYPFSFSLPAANVWTKIVVTIPGDTAGLWVMSGNAGSVALSFDLGSGSTYRAAAGAWLAGGFYGVTGAQSIVNTNAATFVLTGVKLEIGSVATPFNRQSLAKSMADCQRYYQVGQIGFQGYAAASSAPYVSQPYPTQMRAAPTKVITTNNSGNVGTLSLVDLAPLGMGLTLVGSGVPATGLYTLNVNYTASAEL